MWSVSPARLLGSISAQRITLFVLVMIVALFSASMITATSVQAQATENNPDGMAVWSGENLDYGGVILTRSATPENDDNLPNLLQTDCQDNPNIFYSPVGTRANDNDYYWMYVICLTDGVDGSDKSKPIWSTVLEYQIPRDQYNLGTDKPSKIGDKRSKRVPIAALGTDALGRPIGTPNNAATPSTTCDHSSTQGLGWIICPVTNWLAKGMDVLYDILKSFLAVSPVAENKSLFYMWGLVRNFANILFIVGFLIIIYSQITGVGISTYGIKQLLPRLVIAAVLVNVSFWVTAAAVDISNILGVTLQDTFVEIRSKIPAPENMNLKPEDLSWQSVAGASLSAGMGGLAVGGAIVSLGTTAGASLFLLLPAIVGVIVSALVAILVLAARQALITILIILSPLAFAAYLLPSTEKFFDRWRSLLTTMLVLFPAFAVVFGGSQLAGMAIINSALENNDNPNFFNVIILGMIVQVAPLVITPLLIKLGGSLIGRIAGIVNDPNKGIVDRSRKFAQERHDMHKYKQISEQRKDGKGYAHKNPLAEIARRKALRDIHKDRSLKTYQSGVEAAYEQDRRAHDVHRQSAINEMLKSTGEDTGKAEVAREIANREALRRLYFQQQFKHEDAETENKAVSTLYEGLKAKPSVIASSTEEQRLGEQAEEADRRARSLASREATAKQVQERAYNSLVTDSANAELREFAGFNEIDAHGVARVVNIAQEAEAKTYSALVEAGQRALQREEATLAELEEIIEKGTSSNPKFAHFKGDIESQAAAIRQFMDTAPMRMRQDLAAKMDLSWNAKKGTDKGVLRSEIAAALQKNKPFYISQTFLNQMAEGDLNPIYNYQDGKNRMVLDTLNKFALDAQSMVSIDQDDLGAIADFLEKSPEAAHLSDDARRQIHNALIKAFDKRDRYEGQMGKRRTNLNRIRRSFGMEEINN